LLLFSSPKSIIGNTTVLVLIAASALLVEQWSSLRETAAVSQSVSAGRPGGCTYSRAERSKGKLSEQDRKSSAIPDEP